ncbi:MAG: hypothetical protein IMZ53_00540 [Thermoplasmata archaeon]|nr:hypothetical protein [Thermoplasmata archaeon]
MKRIIETILGVMLFVSLLQAQSNNINVVVGNDTTYYSCSLTASIDTAEIAFTSPHKRLIDSYTITAVSSAVDSLVIQTLSANGSTWVPMGSVNLFSGAATDTIALTTAVREYLLNDPEPRKIRVISLSDDASTSTAIVTAKRSK